MGLPINPHTTALRRLSEKLAGLGMKDAAQTLSHAADEITRLEGECSNHECDATYFEGRVQALMTQLGEKTKGGV